MQDKIGNLNEQIRTMKVSLENLKLENEDLKSEVKVHKFSIDRFKHDEAHFRFYTGLPSYAVFLCFLKPAAENLLYWGNISCNKQTDTCTEKKVGRNRKLTCEEELFLVLVRIRKNFPLEDMAIRFGMSTSNVSQILITWFDFLHTQLRALPIWASRKTVDDTMPKCFRGLYPKTRVIIDCTEIYIESPYSFQSQSATFSNYKHHNTVKGLVGIAPSGAITFVSDLFTGRCSDKQIVKESKILGLLQPGDDLMADGGVNIEESLPSGVTLNISPFLRDNPQLSTEDEAKTRKIASVRVHVERAIRRVKTSNITEYPSIINGC